MVRTGKLKKEKEERNSTAAQSNRSTKGNDTRQINESSNLEKSMEILDASLLNPNSAARRSASRGSNASSSRMNSPLVSAANSPASQHLPLPDGSPADQCECYVCIHGDCPEDCNCGIDRSSEEGEVEDYKSDSDFSYASDCSSKSIPMRSQPAGVQPNSRTLQEFIRHGLEASVFGVDDNEPLTDEEEEEPQATGGPLPWQILDDGGSTRPKSISYRWKAHIRSMLGVAKSHIHVHKEVDLRRRLALSRNVNSRGKMPCSEILVEFDGSHPVLGVDCHGRFLYLYLPEWMPEEIHEHYYAVAAHLIHGRPLPDCEKKKRQGRQSAQKRRKRDGATTPKEKIPEPSNPHHPELGDDYVDSDYGEPCTQSGCYCRKNPNGSLHCGMWCQQGHPNNPKRPLAPTQNLTCDPTIKAAQALLDFNQRTTLLHRMINYVVASVEPWSAGTMLSAVQQAKAQYNLVADRLQDITTMFFGYAFMLNKQTENHCDRNSSEYLVDALATIGNYTEGKLRLPELGVRAAYGPRSLVILRGGIIKHGVEHFKGPHRICLAYFAHRSVLSHLKIRPFVPRKIVDTTQQPPVFRTDAVDTQTWDAVKNVASTQKDDISQSLSRLEFPNTQT